MAEFVRLETDRVKLFYYDKIRWRIVYGVWNAKRTEALSMQDDEPCFGCTARERVCVRVWVYGQADAKSIRLQPVVT